MRILFVGSPRVLPSDMVDHIRDMEAGWEFEFATGGGVEAISAVELQGYDAVIASTDVPDMAPEEMLDEIRHLKPQVIRIALVEGGENARMSSSLMLDAAHRFLPLPLSAETLMDTLGSLEELRDLLGNPWLHAEIGKIEKLPSPPHLYLKLTRALADNSNASAAQIAEIVASDPGIAAKVMQLCNSAFFSFGR
ncbi:MAG: HDOD domain-containing protein, partial [Pseudomonadota bacterium]|nr:HDOD domain-containing protein [Pseudomonadota bacterium]